MARRHGIEVMSPKEHSALPRAIRELTDGRGPDSVIDAVGMEAHGSPVAAAAQKLTGLLPDAVAQPMMQKAGVDRLAVLNLCIETVCRGGTISLSGVYGGMADPLPMLQMFDKGIQLRMGQAHVKRWIDDLMPLVTGDGDPLGVEDLATHRLPLQQAPHGYEIFQKKEDGAIKVILQP
jgi:threonine dehydrogenase-like Zn-dependent dehydrogenase